MRVVQFILGFIIGITLFFGGIAGIGYYFLKDMLKSPEKPTFAEEKPKQTTKTTTAKTTQKSATNKNTQPTPKPSATPTSETETKLPEGAYKATVTWSEGLSVRSNPSIDSERVGGVAYNLELIVLETSSDGKWQKIRTASGNVEGWIKAGNTQKINEE
jgi:hypothetical protein